MADVASLLKTELTRIARRVLRADTAALAVTTKRLRAEVIGLKRNVTALEREVAQLKKAAARQGAAVVPATVEAESTAFRFSPKQFAALRHKLGLSQPEAALLVGVSAQTIYLYEKGESRPRTAEQQQRVVAMRRLTRRDAQAVVEAIKASAP